MTKQELEKIDAAFRAWAAETKPVDEIPGSDHERRIAWYGFRDGWLAALKSGCREGVDPGEIHARTCALVEGRGGCDCGK